MCLRRISEYPGPTSLSDQSPPFPPLENSFDGVPTLPSVTVLPRCRPRTRPLPVRISPSIQKATAESRSLTRLPSSRTPPSSPRWNQVSETLRRKAGTRSRTSGRPGVVDISSCRPPTMSDDNHFRPGLPTHPVPSVFLSLSVRSVCLVVHVFGSPSSLVRFELFDLDRW